MSGAAPLVIQNLIDLKQFADAEQTLRRMDPTAGLEDDGSWERARQKVLIAQIDLGLGRTKKGMARFRSVIAQAQKGGWKTLELDARLAHGTAQLTAGDAAAARRTLESLEVEATSRGMLRVARLAREARQGK
jgi:hypothetical protein